MPVPVLLLAPLLVLAVAATSAPCDDAVRALRVAQAAYEPHEPARRAAVLAAARALQDCPDATATDRLYGRTWEAYVLGHEGRFGEQMAVLDALLADPALADHPSRVLWVHRQRHAALLGLGRPLDALAALHTALALDLTVPPSERAALLLDLAQVYALLGHAGLQKASLRRALDLLDARADAYLYAFALHHLAFTLSLEAVRVVPRDRAALLEAERLAAHALQAAQHVTDPLERRAALRAAHLARAEVANRLGDTATSLAAAREALAATPPHLSPYAALRSLGIAQVRAGLHDEAETTFLRLLAEAEREPLHQRARAHYLLGWAHVEAGRDAEAERHLRRAVDTIDALRTEMGLSVWNARAFADRIGYYDELVALLLRRGRARDAFEVLDVSRARLLRDLRRFTHLQRAHPDARAAVRTVQAELDAVYAALRSAQEPDLPDLQARAALLEAELARLTHDATERAALSVEDLQQLLARDGRVLVAYFLGRLDDGARPPTAFVVTPDAFHAVSLPVPRDSLVARAHAARSALADPGRARTLDPEPLRWLYDALFRPLEPFVPPGVPVTVVPDGPLHALPFAALLQGPAEPLAFRDWPYLLHRNPVSTVLAAALLAAPPPAAHRIPLVAFGRSRFEEASVPPPFTGPPLPPLPHVPDELARLRRYVPRAIVALDEAASADALRALMDRATVVHLASHTYVSLEQPLYSAILLQGESALYLHELLARPLAAALVVLSGCESAHGSMLAGEGVAGLHSAFQAAGAASTLATLWSVDDAAMARLMDRFYAHLARGLPKDRALQQAQLDVLAAAADLDASPFFWAGLTLSGSPAPVPWSDDRNLAWAWALLGLGLLALAYLVGHLPPRHLALPS